MTNRSKWVKPVVVAVAAVAVLALVVGTFQVIGGSDDTANDTPQECKDAGPASRQCREALLQRDLDAGAARALDGVDEATRLEVAEALCEEGSSLLESPDARPLRSEVFDRVAEQAGVSVDAVAAIVPSLDQLCEGDAGPVAALPATSGNAAVSYEAFGSGPVTVEYTSNDGSSVKEEAFLPWFLPVNLQSVTGLEMVVSPRKVEGGSQAVGLECKISVGAKVVASAKAGSKGDAATCSVSEQDVTEAANAAPAAEAPAVGP